MGIGIIPFSILNQALNLRARLRKPILIGAQRQVPKNSIASFKMGNGITQKIMFCVSPNKNDKP